MNDPIARAAALRHAQDMEAALEVIGRAAAQNPNDPQAAFGLAQISFETWRPAAELFARARVLAPETPDVLRNHALALAAEGEGAAAEALLEDALRQNPGWLEGHRVLAAQRITGGEREGFDRSYAEAVEADPANGTLWMMWFQQHATLKDWERAGAILADARAALPDHRGLQMAELFFASESGLERDNAGLFDAYAGLNDPGLDLCRVRHHLRGQDFARAEAIAAGQVTGAAARLFWPYLSLCWRLGDTPGAGWLDGEPVYAATIDLDFRDDEMVELAKVLRSLHRLKAPYPEQSVRGGTQTDRQLFFHPAPAIQNARRKISGAVRNYVANLPAADKDHPLLGPPRDQPIRFEGSWSVRLARGGHHSSHTHVLGWISSALYVALPEDMDGGRLVLGTPPPELGLPLEPYQSIDPKPGRLVLFPSTMWHATEPFVQGERLTIAFDAKLPAAP